MTFTAGRLSGAQVAELDDSRAFQGLTPTQHRFVTLVLSGLSNVEAYRNAYDTSTMADSTVRTKAGELFASPLITVKLRELRERVEAQTSLAPSLSRELILNGIMAIALNGDKDSTRLNAWTTLGKTVGIDLFRDTIVTEKRVRTVDDVEAELKARLQELQSTLTIEGDAKRVEAPAKRERRRKPAGK